MRLLILGSALLVSLGTVPSAMAWTWPLAGPVLRPYSLGPDAYAAGQHRGVDVAGTDGDVVRAPASGTVSFVGVVPSSGKTVTIQLEGYAVSLTHLGATSIGKGASVSEGDPIGTAGTSGEPEWPSPYVHLGVRVSSAADGYVDPLTLLPPRAVAPPPAAPPVQAPSTVPATEAGAATPVIRAEQPTPPTESPTPEVRTPELRAPEVGTQQVGTPQVGTPHAQTPQPRSPETQQAPPAPKHGASTASSPKPAGAMSDLGPASASGQGTGAPTIPIATHHVPSTVRDAHAGDDAVRAALPGQAPSPAAATGPTGSGPQARASIGRAGSEVRPGLLAASTTVNPVRPVPRSVAPAPTSSEIGRSDRTLDDGTRAERPPVTPIGVESKTWHAAVELDTLASPPTGRHATGRHDRRQPLAAEARERMATASVLDTHPVARARVWLTTALLLLLVAVGGGRWLLARDRAPSGRGALLHHDVGAP